MGRDVRANLFGAAFADVYAMTLLPCPFCGKEQHENLDTAVDGGPVMCIACGAQGPRWARLNRALDLQEGNDAIDGLDAWNVRTP